MFKITTHSPWKTISMKQHLKQGDDGKGTGKTVLNRGGVHGPIRQRLAFREAKRAYCRQFNDHVESTGQGNTIPLKTNSNDFGVFEINYQIRIRIASLRKLYFLNDSNFWCVQSSITHTMWL